jgi:DNA-binding beta-propeller fold protein YncE
VARTPSNFADREKMSMQSAAARWSALLLCSLLGACGGGGTSTAKVATASATVTANGQADHAASVTFAAGLDPVTDVPRLEFVAGSIGGVGNLDGKGTEARFNNPHGIAIDSAGRRFVVDWQNHVIRKVETDGTVSTFAGGTSQRGAIDGVGSAARFSFPLGIAIDSDDTLYVTDSENSTIRKITPDGVVSTLAGRARAEGNVDGAGVDARRPPVLRSIATKPST